MPSPRVLEMLERQFGDFGPAYIQAMTADQQDVTSDRFERVLPQDRVYGIDA